MAAQIPEYGQAEEVSYGSGSADVQTLTVSLPGSKVPVRLYVTPLPESVAKYVPEASEARIISAGSFRLRFTLSIASRVAVPAAFIAQANGETLPGGAFAVYLRAGRQDWSGEVSAPLSEGDAIKLVFTSVSPARIELGGSDIPAVLSVSKQPE